MNHNLKKFKIVDSVRATGWKYVLAIVKIFGDVEVIESRWNERFKRENLDLYPLDLSNINTWSTFDKCCDFQFEFIDHEFFKCTAHIYKGDMVYGKPKNLKFTAELKIPVKHLNIISDKIGYRFTRYLHVAHEKQLEHEANIWMADCAKELLKDENH